MINKLKKLIKTSDVILYNDGGCVYGCTIKFINQHCFEVSTSYFCMNYSFKNIKQINNNRIECFDEESDETNVIYFMKYLSA